MPARTWRTSSPPLSARQSASLFAPHWKWSDPRGSQTGVQRMLVTSFSFTALVDYCTLLLLTAWRQAASCPFLRTNFSTLSAAPLDSPQSPRRDSLFHLYRSFILTISIHNWHLKSNWLVIDIGGIFCWRKKPVFHKLNNSNWIIYIKVIYIYIYIYYII